MATTLEQSKGPAWEVATLFPDQGHWGEGDYLALSRVSSRLLELSDGCVEVVAMPTKTHQRIVLWLYNALFQFVQANHRGEILVAPYPMRLLGGRFREPDVLFMLAENAGRLREEYAEGADLVMEVVSKDNRAHDLITERNEYAAAGIPEYWIIDPAERRITVLKLRDDAYEAHTEATDGQAAGSALLPGFSVEVSAVFQAAAVNSHASQ